MPKSWHDRCRGHCAPPSRATGWTEEDLWRVCVPPRAVPLEAFAWLLDVPVWRWGGRRWQLSIRQVLDDPEQYRAHVEKAERADLRYPIHATPGKGGNLVVLDGYHRLLKALRLGDRTIPVAVVTADDLPRHW